LHFILWNLQLTRAGIARAFFMFYGEITEEEQNKKTLDRF
jgi:hypothetical protein